MYYLTIVSTLWQFYFLFQNYSTKQAATVGVNGRDISLLSRPIDSFLMILQSLLHNVLGEVCETANRNR